MSKQQDEVKQFFQKSVFPYLTFGMSFPLAFIPKENYKSSRLGFLAERPAIAPGVLHGACDLIAPVGTDVFAVDSGTVLSTYFFYEIGITSVHAIEIQHKFFTIRYGEVDKKSILVKAGQQVEKGQPIAKVGKIGQGSMLHFEIYSGAATGPLTIRGKHPFNRRSDLMDPAPFLDVWRGNLPSK